MGESSSNKRPPAAAAAASLFTDDLFVEILSRVPYSSLCRFKCVSKSWLALCSDPDLRKKSAQTLSGFFYQSIACNRTHHFTNQSGRGQPMVDPSLSFLPSCSSVQFVDCCNGLLLCLCIEIFSSNSEPDYVVCNPATQKWTALPKTEAMQGLYTMRLAFDPAVSSHFRVFLVVWIRQGQNLQVTGEEIYSSVTWSRDLLVGNWRVDLPGERVGL